MGKTIGKITQEGKNKPFKYRVFRENWPNRVFNELEVESRLIDNHYILYFLSERTSFNHIFGVVCNEDREKADKRLYDFAKRFAGECDEVKDNTHYAQNKLVE